MYPLESLVLLGSYSSLLHTIQAYHLLFPFAVVNELTHLISHSTPIPFSLVLLISPCRLLAVRFRSFLVIKLFSSCSHCFQSPQPFHQTSTKICFLVNSSCCLAHSALDRRHSLSHSIKSTAILLFWSPIGERYPSLLVRIAVQRFTVCSQWVYSQVQWAFCWVIQCSTHIHHWLGFFHHQYGWISLKVLQFLSNDSTHLLLAAL